MTCKKFMLQGILPLGLFLFLVVWEVPLYSRWTGRLASSVSGIRNPVWYSLYDLGNPHRWERHNKRRYLGSELCDRSCVWMLYCSIRCGKSSILCHRVSGT